MNDIDDIFSKPTSKPSEPIASTSAAPPAKKKVKKAKVKQNGERDEAAQPEMKEKKRKPSALEEVEAGTAELPAKKTKKAREDEPAVAAVEVVTLADTSQVKPSKAAKPIKGKGKSKAMDEEEEMFRDSRGEGPRRKTEEGFMIFKEAELDIDPEAGGTPLCPFDCDCCF